MTDPMSNWAFQVFVTIITGGVSLVWFGFDLRSLLRARKQDGTNPSIRDRKFGYSMGLVIATIGVVGSTIFWL